jgi:long-chain acyl-CoA synthetase
MPTLLLTGATGMVGREILSRAAAGGRFDRIFCVVRPPLDRFASLLADQGITNAPHVTALAGDVTEPDLGTSVAALADVTHVIHCAATVSFDHPLEEARRINVGGTRTVLGVCRRLPRLERLDAVSTCYVAGRRSDLVREADLADAHGFNNTYEQTKYESELELRAAMKDLPIAVHRPSIVVGDSRTGKTGAFKVLYWPLKVIARGWLPIVPYDPDAQLDIVPVDYVTSAILALSADPATIGSTFHLAAGPGRDTTLGTLAQHLSARFGRRLPLRVRPMWWQRLVRPALMMMPAPALRRTLETGLVYRPYLQMRLRFDTTETRNRLDPRGVKCPRVVDYIDTIVDAAIASDFGKRPLPTA